jgi:hypothetical protein
LKKRLQNLIKNFKIIDRNEKTIAEQEEFTRKKDELIKMIENIKKK